MLDLMLTCIISCHYYVSPPLESGHLVSASSHISCPQPTILAQIASNLVGRYPWVVSRRHSIFVTLTPFSRSPGHICCFTMGNVVRDLPSNCFKFGREVPLGCLSATFDFGDLDPIFKVTRRTRRTRGYSNLDLIFKVTS